MKTQLITVVVAALFPFTLLAQEPSKASGPDAKIIAKLTELVQIREQQVEIEQALYKSGRASAENGAGVEAAQVELAEARVDLALEQGVREALITALQGLVAANEQRVEWAIRMKELARASDVGVKQAQAELLKAQVRLLRAQK
ncbi:hypothetical protein [Prosthecobacter fluviatilis]|uniref:Outer membrane efflux protein n=1 Tax=Prosthecobacter fluviatilis TaxID=445931 RepID=A0ABW0KNQ2_9BACT